jgi:hypothetical protein
LAAQCLSRACLAVASLLAAAVAQADEEFLLEVPGDPSLTSRAVLSGDTLFITGPDGEEFEYVRQPAWDTPDGHYWGFSSDQAGKALLWPVNGSGAMQIGTAGSRRPTWRQSRQRVRLVRGPPVAAGGTGGPPTRGSGVVAIPNLAVHPMGTDEWLLAHVSPLGDLRVYAGVRDEWQHVPFVPPVNLPPHSALCVVHRPGAVDPSILAIDATGQIVEVDSFGRTSGIRTTAAVRFVPGGGIANVRGLPNLPLWTVSQEGELWQIDPNSRSHALIESGGGMLIPGCPISAAVVGTTLEVFVIDRVGRLIGFQVGGPRTVVEVVSANLCPAGSVACVEAGADPVDTPPHLAVVGMDGHPRLIRWTRSGWEERRFTNARFNPQAAVAIQWRNNRLLLSGVLPDGTWVEWIESPGGWQSSALSGGFLPGSPVAMLPPGDLGVAFDRAGRPVASRRYGGGWYFFPCRPLATLMPRLVSQKVIPNPPLPPVEIVFENKGAEELLLLVRDRRQAQAPAQERIEASGSLRVTIDRDSGGIYQEVELRPMPDGSVVESVFEQPIPPAVLYDVVVYANSIVYSYRDPRGISGVPDFDTRAPRSVGVFSLPPGDSLEEGVRLDALRIAASQGNPGTAGLFGPPRP